MAELNAAAQGDVLPVMLEVDLDISDFRSNWANCDQLSSYVSRMISHNRVDSLLFNNLYSSALNEMLETVFRVHGGQGKLVCAARRQGTHDRIELTIPSDEGTANFYRNAVETTRRDDADQIYLNTLFEKSDSADILGLLELAVDYGARLSLRRLDTDRICLIADLALEEAET